VSGTVAGNGRKIIYPARDKITCGSARLQIAGFNNEIENVLTDDSKVFPNPVKDVLYVKCPKDSEIEIVNIVGTLVKSKISTSIETSINVSDLVPGLYVVMINSKEGVKRHKLVIE